VFAKMRRKNRSTKMKSELGQSVDHFRRAASLAAEETSATVGPKFYAARDRVQPTAVKARDAASSGWDSTIATLGPLITAASEKAQLMNKTTAKASKKDVKASKKNAKKLKKRTDKALGRKQKRRTGSKLGGLLLAGAAVGAVGAYVVRKRQRDQWDEYDAGPVSSPRTDVDRAAFEPAPSSPVTPVDETTSAAGAAASDPSLGAVGVDPTVGAGKAEPTIELVDADTADQTSSAQHSPKVARMASGQNKN